MRILPGFPPTPPREERVAEKRRSSCDLSDRRAHDPLALQRARDAQHEILAPGRPDDLYADRQRHALGPDGNRAYWQSDERERLREQSQVRPDQHLAPGEPKGLLA